MDNEHQRSALGAGGGRQKKSNASKVKNPLNDRQNRVANQGPPPIQPRIELPTYEAGTTLRPNWASVPGMFGIVVDQRGETCVSVCLCGLAQATYNRGKAVASHLEFSVQDLDNYVRGRIETSAVSNLRMVFEYASETGFLKSSGRINARRGTRVHAQCDERKHATAEDVYNMIDQRPLAIGLKASPDFINLKDEIYVLPTDEDADHAVLVVAKGLTDSIERFLVIQNSWGDDWGVRGYARIQLKPKDEYHIFWVQDI